jgi:hypothetical protein
MKGESDFAKAPGGHSTNWANRKRKTALSWYSRAVPVWAVEDTGAQIINRARNPFGMLFKTLQAPLVVLIILVVAVLDFWPIFQHEDDHSRAGHARKHTLEQMLRIAT